MGQGIKENQSRLSIGAIYGLNFKTETPIAQQYNIWKEIFALTCKNRSQAFNHLRRKSQFLTCSAQRLSVGNAVFSPGKLEYDPEKQTIIVHLGNNRRRKYLKRKSSLFTCGARGRVTGKWVRLSLPVMTTSVATLVMWDWDWMRKLDSFWTGMKLVRPTMVSLRSATHVRGEPGTTTLRLITQYAHLFKCKSKTRVLAKKINKRLQLSL